MPSKSFKKSIVVLVVCAFVFVNAAVLFVPQKANAQFAVTVPFLEGMSVRDWIVKELIGLGKGIVFQGIFNSLNYFLQRMAYDAATYLAAGGKGEGPLFEYKNWEDYLTDVGLDTAGEFIGTMSEGWPVDLCAPALPDLMPQITMNIQLGIANTYEPRPRCRWNEIQANWDNFIANNSSASVLAEYGRSLNPGEGGLSSILSLTEKMQTEEALRREAASESRQEGRGLKPVTMDVSGYIETPGVLLEESIKEKLVRSPQRGTEQQVSSSFSILDSLSNIGLNFATMFLNTLTSNLFNNIMGGLMDVGELVSEKGSLWDLSATAPSGGRIAAEAIFADLLTPNLLSITDYNPTMQFTMCPSERGSENCIMDSSLAAAINQAESGNFVTVKDALKKGYLHSNWPLVPLSDTSRNQDPNCYTYGYCYSNLVKLRKARIIPIGWELAANSSANNVGNPVTLGEVIKNFNNEESPYYHLINPNWILKYPLHQCSLQVYGPRLLSSQGDVREQVCADMPSCIEDGNNGDCLGAWGYCTREKNIWRMTADTCDKEYSSCETLTTRQGKKVSYLRNTMDYNDCNESNVGCQWYSLSKTGDDWSPADRIYLNKNTEVCSINAVGCADLIRKGAGVSQNYIRNSSFEDDEDGDGVPDNWSAVGAGHLYDISSIVSYHATDAVSVPGNIVNYFEQENVNLPAGNYTISAYAKQDSADSNYRALIKILGEVGEINNINCLYETSHPDRVTLEFSPESDFYERGECSFVLNSSATVKIRLLTDNLTDAKIWLDAIQLEEGIRATSYREEGYPFTAEHTNLRKPPEYLGCAGDILTDKSGCFNYARVCGPEDVGCELFTPTNGDPSIAASVTLEDVCPAECNGYDLFRQGETNFENENPEVYLIPQNSRECSYDVAGCDEFTIADTEEKVYYSFLRSCSSEISQGAIYYTWEGSDTAGYQLKSWSLLRGFPIVVRDDDGIIISVDTGNPPAYQSGFTDYDLCTEEIFRSGAEPDCREFYDELGNISYRLYSKTIVVSSDCKELRRTSWITNLESQNDCLDAGGRWDGTYCFYNGYLPESVSCESEYAGCRAYTGSTGRNVRILFNDTFEGGDISGWNKSGRAVVSAESLQVGGHSLTGLDYEVGKHVDVRQGGVYTLSFWAKGPLSNLAVEWSGFDHSAPEQFSPLTSPRVTITNEWRLYNLGPVYLENPRAGGETLEFIPRSISGGEASMRNVYLDNIILREVIENIYLIKNSWTIPASCDMTIQGAPLPQAMVGCQEYKDRNNITRYLKSFEKLCSEDVVGCEAFIDTKNTASPFEEVWNVDEVDDDPVDNLTIPADETIYLVYDEKFSCDSADIGCSKVGYPEIERTETTATEYFYQDQYIKINPRLFSYTLCKNSELFCEEFRTTNGSALYAKDPRERLCEFKETDTQTGWFKKGTDESCDYAGDYRIWRNADADYAGWVGECPASESGCTTLVDVADKSLSEYPDGKPYFVIRNEKLDTKSCAGKVSRAEGCVLFNDINDPAAYFRADSTYFKSRDEASGGNVSAVSCPENIEDCQRCIGVPRAGGMGIFDRACGIADDCAGLSDDYIWSCDYPGGSWAFENDTNLIVKVTPDRVCGEWLACRSAVTVYDEVAGRNKKICTSVDLCREFEVSGENESRCVKFVEGDDAGEILDLDNYQDRDVSWGGMEYAGYSIPNQYQISDLEAVEIDGNKRLVFVEDRAGSVYRGLDGSSLPSYLYSREAKRIIAERSCRAYPEQNSPFPYTVADWDRYFDKETKGAMSAKKQGFTSTQVREKYVWLDGDADNIVDKGAEIYLQNGECSYKKATYGRGTLTKYYDYDQEFLPEGICFGGARDGLPCAPGVEEICGPSNEGGTCERLTRADKYLGLEGYCVEYDYSMNINGSRNEYPCLTWRPVEIPEGGQDVYNQYTEAGYNPPSAGVGKYYCLAGRGNADSVEARYSFTSTHSKVVGTASTATDAYRERIYPRDDGDPLYKQDIAAIVLSITTWDEHSPTPEERSLFIENDKNILSRKSKHNGELEIDGRKYSYWEVRFPDTDDGISDWISGAKTFGTEKPLFAAQSAMDTGHVFSIGGGMLDFNNMVDMSCDGGEEATVTAGNYGAVRAMFDEENQYQGLWVVYCDDSAGAGEMEFNIEFLKTEYCQYLAQVVDNDGDHAARTHRLWEFSDFAQSTGINPGTTNPYLYDQDYTPFGSAASGFKDPTKTSDAWFVGEQGNGSPYFTTAYFPGWVVDGGSVLSCLERTSVILGETTRCYDNSVDFDDPLLIRLSSAISQLRELFAKSFGIYGYTTATSPTGPSETRYRPVVSSIAEDWDNTSDIGKRTIVAAPNLSRGLSLDVPRVVALNSISLNEQITGIVYGDKNFEGTIRFYAWADKDQMPIRSISVMWGDNTPVQEFFGSYKNHKPYCSLDNLTAINECVATRYTSPAGASYIVRGLTCSDNSECFGSTCEVTTEVSFGNSPSACEEGYFEMSHEYTCQEEDIESLSECLITGGVTWDGSDEDAQYVYNTPCCIRTPYFVGRALRERQDCVFRPAVRVTDNWGWCTASTKERCSEEEFIINENAVGFAGVVIVSP